MFHRCGGYEDKGQSNKATNLPLIIIGIVANHKMTISVAFLFFSEDKETNKEQEEVKE